MSTTSSKHLSAGVLLPSTPTERNSVDLAIRAAIRETIKSCALSRAMIADRMQRSVGRRVTKNMVDAFASASKCDRRIPAELVPAFCQVCGDDRLLRTLLSDGLREMLEYGEAEFLANERRARIEQRRTSPKRRSRKRPA